LLDWQRWLAIHALELDRSGGYRFRVVLALCGRQNGKSSLLRTLTLWKLYVDGARLALGVAQDLTTARHHLRQADAAVLASPDLARERVKLAGTIGDERLLLANGAEYRISAANRDAGRGLSVDLLVIDEVARQRETDAWAALNATTRARPNAQTWAISTMGDDSSVVLNHLRESALAERDPSIGSFEWSGQEGCDLDDRKAWAQANPALGRLFDERLISSALASDPPPVFRTEVLNQRVDQLDGAVDLQAWRSCSDAMGTLDSARERVMACVDVAPDGEHVTLAAAAESQGRVRVEVVAAWGSTQAARDALTETLSRVDPKVVVWYPSGPAAALAPVLRGLDGVESVEIKGTAVAEACMGFADLVASRGVVHPGDPLLDAHVAAASKYRQGDGYRFARRGGLGHVDAAYAAAGAVQAVLTHVEEPPLPRPMVV
ncbi:MAG: terminase large subunit domain-containing protein, partial [Nocardioidaceae bacterium]